MPDPMEPVRRPDATAASVSLERALERARWAILWERLWPPLAALLTVIGLFLAVSWVGLWLWLFPALRRVDRPDLPQAHSSGTDLP